MTKKIGKYVVRTDPYNTSPDPSGFPYDGGFIKLKSISFDVSTCCVETNKQPICPPLITSDGRWDVSGWAPGMFFKAFASPNPLGKRFIGETGVIGKYGGMGPFKPAPPPPNIWNNSQKNMKYWKSWYGGNKIDGVYSSGEMKLVGNFTKSDPDFILNKDQVRVKPGGWYFNWSSKYSEMFLYNEPGPFMYTNWKAFFSPLVGTEKLYSPECISNFNKNARVDLQSCGLTQENCPVLTSSPSPVPPHTPTPHTPTPHTPTPHTPTPVPPHSPSPHVPPPGPSPAKNGLSTGLIVGIVSIILVALLVTIMYTR
jgi:hypothetical protein